MTNFSKTHSRIYTAYTSELEPFIVDLARHLRANKIDSMLFFDTTDNNIRLWVLDAQYHKAQELYMSFTLNYPNS